MIQVLAHGRLRDLWNWLKRFNPIKVQRQIQRRNQNTQNTSDQAEAKNYKRDLQRIQAKQEAEQYKQNLENEALLLWEADGKPEGKEDYYLKLAEYKIANKYIDLPIIYKPYFSLGKKILEPADIWISRQVFFSMLGRFGNIVMIAALLSFVFGETHRRNVEIFAAWTTIYTAHGQPGSDRRIEALEFLNSRPPKFPWIGLTKKDWYWDSWRGKCVERLWGLRWERETLDGLSVGLSNETNQNRVYLEGIKLCGAKLNGANFQSADLRGANLQSAHLVRANLQSAHLWEANLQSADLVRANFQSAHLWEANLQSTDLREANLQSAYLKKANLQSAVLINVKNLTPKQIKSSCNWKQALFEAEWNGKKQIWKAVEPKNTDFIKVVAEDKASNPKNSPDCSLWNKQE